MQTLFIHTCSPVPSSPSPPPTPQPGDPKSTVQSPQAPFSILQSRVPLAAPQRDQFFRLAHPLAPDRQTDKTRASPVQRSSSLLASPITLGAACKSPHSLRHSLPQHPHHALKPINTANCGSLCLHQVLPPDCRSPEMATLIRY